jgi:hypothetical protein
MKVYVAAPYAARDHVRELFASWYDTESDNGWLDLTSGWLQDSNALHKGTLDATPDHSDELVRFRVGRDFSHIEQADALLLLTGRWVLDQGWVTDISQTTSGGRHVETGCAIALGIPVIVIGQPENVFHRAACVVVPDFQTAIRHL